MDRLVPGEPNPLRVIALMDRLRHQWAGSLNPRRADAPSGDRADGSDKASVSMDRLVRVDDAPSGDRADGSVKAFWAWIA
jgi:hypothetical protein